MEFYDVLKKRRAVRSFTEEAVPQEVIAKLQEAVKLAPTGLNKQPFKFLFVRNQELIRRIAKLYPYPADWADKQLPPMIVAVLINADEAWHRDTGESIAGVDAAIAMEHLQLAAAAEGLASCWICAFNQATVDLLLDVRKPWTTFALSPVGFGKAVPTAPRTNKNDNELFKVID